MGQQIQITWMSQYLKSVQAQYLNGTERTRQLVTVFFQQFCLDHVVYQVILEPKNLISHIVFNWVEILLQQMACGWLLKVPGVGENK